MAQAKKQDFDAQAASLAELARALSHPARIAILELLAARDTCICGEIVEELPLSQSTVSQHLKALKEAGLIQGEIEGPKTCYCLSQSGISKLKRLLPRFLGKLETATKRLSSCCEKEK